MGEVEFNHHSGWALGLAPVEAAIGEGLLFVFLSGPPLALLALMLVRLKPASASGRWPSPVGHILLAGFALQLSSSFLWIFLAAVALVTWWSLGEAYAGLAFASALGFATLNCAGLPAWRTLMARVASRSVPSILA
jgi:hypothetical protein